MSYNLPDGTTNSDIDEANQCYAPCDACGEREWDVVVTNATPRQFRLCGPCEIEYDRNETLRERLAKKPL